MAQDDYFPLYQLPVDTRLSEPKLSGNFNDANHIMTEAKSNNPAETNAPRQGHAPLWIIAVVFGVVAIFLFVLGWGLRQANRAPVTPGSPVPDFSVTTQDGRQLNSQELRGKVLVINFWASWCQPCQQEAPILQKAWQQWQPDGDIILIGINYDDSPRAASEFLSEYGITYPNVLENIDELSRQFGVTGVPVTYLVDADGVIVDIVLGPFLDETELTQWVEQGMD